MKLVLDIPAELEAELTAKAEQEGTDVERYVLSLLANDQQQAQPRNGAELVAFWECQGVIGTRQDVEDSQVHARILRETTQHRGSV